MGMGKKRNKIVTTVRAPVTHTEKGASREEENAVRASPVLETEREPVECLVCSSLHAACR